MVIYLFKFNIGYLNISSESRQHIIVILFLEKGMKVVSEINSRGEY